MLPVSAQKLLETMGSNRPNAAKPYWVDKAIDETAFFLERIDKQWPWGVSASRRFERLIRSSFFGAVITLRGAEDIGHTLVTVARREKIPD
jgi:endonuclease YncB( thermonuclease family)